MIEILSSPESSPKSNWLSLGLSLSIHVLMLLSVVFWLAWFSPVVNEAPERTGEIVLAMTRANASVDYFKESDDSSETTVAATSVPLADPSAPTVELTPKPLGSGPATAPVGAASSPLDMSTSGTHSNPKTEYKLSPSDLKLIDEEQRRIAAARPAGPATAIRIFGSPKLEGRRFVFLIDRSHSMGDQGLGVLRRARIELKTAIDQLESHHSFQIVVYHDRTSTIARREMLPATDENKNLVPQFMDSLVAFGGTNHQNGLYAALAFGPDVIVMMTDGGDPELHAGNLRAIQGAAGKTEIHTIQFGLGDQQRQENFMRPLALQNSGSYQYINVRKWRGQENTN